MCLHVCFLDAQKFQEDPQVVYCRTLVEKGAKVTCVEDGLPTWVAEVRPAGLAQIFIGSACIVEGLPTWVAEVRAAGSP
jgi:hypothetical protein